MTDEDPEFEEVEYEDVELTPAIDTVEYTLDSFLATADVNAVYGEPVEHGDTLIIPAAEVLCGMGFGVGYGEGDAPAGKDEKGETTDSGGGSGGGGGGGGRVLSRPVAVIIAGPQGVRVEPVVDITKIALAALTTAGFMIGMLARIRKGQISE